MKVKNLLDDNGNKPSEPQQQRLPIEGLLEFHDHDHDDVGIRLHYLTYVCMFVTGF